MTSAPQWPKYTLRFHPHIYGYFWKLFFLNFSLLSTQKQCFGPLRTKCNLKHKAAGCRGGEGYSWCFDITVPGILGCHVHLSIFNRFCAFMWMICGLGLRGTKFWLAYCKQYLFYSVALFFPNVMYFILSLPLEHCYVKKTSPLLQASSTQVFSLLMLVSWGLFPAIWDSQLNIWEFLIEKSTSFVLH